MIETDVISIFYRLPVDPTDPSEACPALPGWHVNITVQGLAARPDLAAYVVTPSQLRQEWARLPGEPQVTVALRFADEAEARAVLGLGDA